MASGRQGVTIVAGDCEPHAWCAACQAPTRVRLALHDGDGGPLLGVVEVCPGCGSNHATPSVTVTAEPQSRPLLARFRRAPLAEADLCAYGDCRKRASRDHQHVMAGDEGTWTYLFCGDRHRRAWAEAHRIALPEAGG